VTPTEPIAAFATIARPVDLPLVQSLASELAVHHRGAPLYVLALGALGGPEAPPPDIGGTTSVPLHAMPVSADDLVLARVMLDDEHLRMALAPCLLAHVVRAQGGPVIFLAPDTSVVGPLPVPEGDLVTLLPRLRSLPRDTRSPAADELAAMPPFDGGFLGVPGTPSPALEVAGADLWAGGPPSLAAIDHFWSTLPARVPHRIVNDDGVGLAYWNLWERTDRVADGVTPPAATSIRLPGFNPGEPYLLSALQGFEPRVLVSELPELGRWLRSHASRLRALGLTAIPEDAVGGLVIDDAVRATTTAAVEEPAERTGLLRALGDGPDAFREWLATAPAGSYDPRVSRYLVGFWAANRHAHAMFARPTDDHADPYLDWVTQVGATLGVPSRFMPVESMTSDAPPVVAPTRPGVNLVGFLQAGFGIGEATRLFAAALAADGIEHAAISVSHDELPDVVQHSGSTSDPVFDTNLICVNVDWLDVVRRRLGDDFIRSRYSIGTWWWESNVLPERLVRQIPQFDELWVGSTFIADALRAYTDRPIRVFPLPIPVPEQHAPPDRAILGLPEGFLFMFSFDFNSTVERKNPAGVIRAFCAAFEPDSGPSLVVKSINGHRNVAELERLRALAADRDDIMVVDRFLPSDERDEWTRACDCYVSLHRCEGFGLTMAEAMALGKPVIATGYSANLDFMDASTALLVNFEPWVLASPSGPYPAGTQWADPDLEHAAGLMRAVAADPAHAHEVGQRARRHMLATRPPSVLADFVRTRLEEIRMEELDGGSRVKKPLPGPLQDSADYDAARRDEPSGGHRRLIRRAIKPYSASADALMARLVDSDRWLYEHGEVHAERLRAVERATHRLDAQTREGRLADDVDALARRLEALEARLYPRLYMSAPSSLLIEDSDGRATLGYDSTSDPNETVDVYAGFEDVFRGPTERVQRGLAPYVPMLKCHQPVLDIGCGQGEMLDLLRDAGINARGIDLDAGMVARATANGLEVERADALEYLPNQHEGSLGAVFAAQVVEHIPWPSLHDLLVQVRTALRGDGILIAETVNPHCLESLKAFWLDPTHQHPIFPEAMLVFCQTAGFSRASIRFTEADLELDEGRRRSPSYAVIAER
jgi:SAM-dependent methyltransferase/glycosyltransferase involved in cell wall biosynthesis